MEWKGGTCVGGCVAAPDVGVREEAEHDVGSSLLCICGEMCGGEDWELVGAFAKGPGGEEVGKILHQRLPGRKVWIWKPAEGRIFWEESMLGNSKLLEEILDGPRKVGVGFALWRKSFVRRHGELGGRENLGASVDRSTRRSVKKRAFINDVEAWTPGTLFMKYRATGFPCTSTLGHSSVIRPDTDPRHPHYPTLRPSHPGKWN